MARGTAALVGRSLIWVAAVLALVGTGLLTVPRLLELDGRRGVELVALTPLGLVPAVVLTLAGVALVLLHRGAGRLLAAVLLVAGLVASAVHVEWLAPLYTGERAGASGPALVVMTQNLEYGDVAAVVGEVRSRRVDVLVLCDLGEAQSAAVQASDLRAELPFVADVAGGAVAYSRYLLSDDTPIPLHGSGRSVRLETSPLGPVTLFALHPVQPYKAGVWQEDMTSVLDALRERVAQADGPIIVAGDLNATLDHWPMRDIASLGFVDAVDAVGGGFQPTFPASGRERRFGITVPPLVQIDHVLVSRQLVVSQVERVATRGADHLGVLAAIRRAAR